MKTNWFFVAGVMVLALFQFACSPSKATTQDAGTWQVAGVMSDACQCMVFCPCEFMSTPTFGHCDDAAILHIEAGHFGKVKLDGLRVAVVSKSPEGERLVDTAGRLEFARIYVPLTATEEQTEALASVAGRIFGAFVTGAVRISENEQVHKVDMKVMIEPHRHQVEIPNVLSVEIETLTGADGKTPMIFKNGPFEGAGFGEVQIAHSKTYTYKDSELGIDWNYGGRSASIRSFEMGGEL